MPLAGGILQHGYQCGMIWGAALAAGAQAYRRFGPGPKAETMAVVAAQRLVASFQRQNKDINCLEITANDKSSSTMKMITFFLLKGGVVSCFRMAVRYARSAFDEIDAVLSLKEIEPPAAPVSCAAVLARQTGASALHSVMAAGLAGGIGLSGGACGALGAAMWMLGMNGPGGEGGSLDYKSPRALEAVHRFLQCTGYEFECSQITGKTFGNIGNHADYVREGGCSKIIATLGNELTHGACSY